MEADYTAYLTKLNDEELGLFWIIASPKARQWIKEELIRRAGARGELPGSQTMQSSSREAVAAA
jgi:hypothetical protein